MTKSDNWAVLRKIETAIDKIPWVHVSVIIETKTAKYELNKDKEIVVTGIKP